jgi:PPM family protein phosphatase
MKFSVAQESRIGGRAINQDRADWAATDAAVMLVVADGMGGHMQGEVAAQIAIDTIIEQFRTYAVPRLVDPPSFLAAAMHAAHQSIVTYATECRIPAHAAPRTTCIVCVIQDGTSCWAHAGDSRLYMVHSNPGAKTRVAHTRDHSVVQRMLDEGKITREEADRHPMRHRVFSCLGGDAEPQIEVSAPVALSEGDVVALCTDGAWAPMGPLGEKMVASLGQGPLTSTVPDLLDKAETAAGAGADNLTIIALRWESPAVVLQDFLDTITLNISPAAKQPVADQLLSDPEIERAIDEIRQRFAKTTKSNTSKGST